MARLPTPGGDNGTWGIILNDFLSVSFDTEGALKADSVGTSQLVNNAVTPAKIQNYASPNGVASLNAGGVVPDAQLPTRLSTAQLNTTYAAAGSTLPSAGTTGQLLTKNSNTNYDATWANPGFAKVAVTSGSETRPSAAFVMWIGGTTQPTNMAVGDVWMKAV